MKELVLPWPSRVLHPNRRVHWAQRAKEAKHARETTHLLTIEAGWHRLEWPEGDLFVWIDFYPPDRRHRDTDGMLSSMKSALDGMADAMGVNDRRFVPRPYCKDEVRKGGAVVVRITGGPDEN